MRFWDHVAGLSPAGQLALVTDLTLGCGHLTLAGRLHQDGGRTVVVLGSLAAAHRSLAAALRALDSASAAGADAGAAYRPALADALPRLWRDVVEGAPPEVGRAWLQLARPAAGDAARAALDDADIADVGAGLEQALGALAAVRETVAHAGDERRAPPPRA